MTCSFVKETAEKLIKCKEAYYNGTPLVSDEEFDALEDELRTLYPENEYFSLVGAPSIGENKRTHKIAMGSQAKVKIDDGGIDKVIDQFFSKDDIIYSRKMDGISVAVEYKNGKFQHATTRGDGFVGDDIPNAIQFINIPEDICNKDYDEITFTARGELFIRYSDFDKINTELLEDEKFSNPRNAVSGIARKEDSPYRKYIEVKYYDIVTDEIEFDFKHQKLVTLADIFGDSAVVWYKMDFNPHTFREEAERLDKERKDLPYMIDGLVIELNNIHLFENMGVANGNKPKGSVALKFNAIVEKTKVTDVVWQVGSTGNLTPVVEFEPTLIDGSIVRRASIHNYDIFTEWNFGKGDVIEVQKNNDIIPQVKSVVEQADSDRYVRPYECPECGSTLELIAVAKTTNLVCINPVCSAKRVGAIKKWCTKAGMTSKGVGDAFFESYVNYCEAQDDGFTISKIYCLTIDDIMGMSDRYKTKSATKIYDAIQSSKNMKLMDVFGGLNIYGCGSRTFKKIIDASGTTSIVGLYDYCMMNDLTKIDGIGDVTAKSIVDGLPECHGDMVFMSSEIEVIQEQTLKSDLGSFLFTGKFSLKRKDLEEHVVNAGGTISSSVNKDLSYLVQSDPTSTSSKSKKAIKLGVAIIGEDEFWELLPKI